MVWLLFSYELFDRLFEVVGLFVYWFTILVLNGSIGYLGID